MARMLAQTAIMIMGNSAAAIASVLELVWVGRSGTAHEIVLTDMYLTVYEVV